MSLHNEHGTDDNAGGYEAKYNLDADSFDVLQADLIGRVEGYTEGKSGLYAIWMNSDSEYANLVRTLEAIVFPEVTAFISPDVENCSRFLAIVDTRAESDRIVHAFRATGKPFYSDNFHAEGTDIGETDSSTGIVMIEEVLVANPDLLRTELIDFYNAKGIDLSSCISIETNFRVGDKVETDNGLRVSDLGYIAIFHALSETSGTVSNAGVFAYLNDQAKVSLGAIGVTHEPIAGKDSLGAPLADTEGEFDDHYTPCFIPGTTSNMAVFQQLEALGVPEFLID